MMRYFVTSLVLTVCAAAKSGCTTLVVTVTDKATGHPVEEQWIRLTHSGGNTMLPEPKVVHTNSHGRATQRFGLLEFTPDFGGNGQTCVTLLDSEYPDARSLATFCGPTPTSGHRVQLETTANSPFEVWIKH